MLRKAIGFSLISLFIFPSVSYSGLELDVDLGVNVNIGDDDLFLRINARYFDKDPEFMRGVVRKHRISDIDYPIVFFLARHSNKDIDFIISLRKQGYSWWKISLNLGIPVSVYYVELKDKPGPPYGKAYGYWKKHKKNPKYKFVLTDEEVYDLVSLKMTSQYYSMSPNEVIKLRQAGIEFKNIITNQYWKHRSMPGHDKSKSKGKKNKNNKGGKKK